MNEQVAGMKLSNLLTRCLTTAMMMFAVVTFLPSIGHAEGTIENIRVEGVHRIPADTVLNDITLSPGDAFDAKAIQKSIKALYDTGNFKDVTFEREGNTLVILVTENSMVDQVIFEGNKAIDDSELSKVVKLQTDNTFTKAQTDQDIAAIQQTYRVKGLFLAKVDLQIKPMAKNRVNLVYKISEGDKSKVREVRIVGNKELSDKTLMKGLLIKPSNWLSWYTDEDTYDSEKLKYDQAQLKNIYMDMGYVQNSVDSSVAELTADRSAFIVTHTVREGPRFRLGKVTLSGDFNELPESELYDELHVEEGEWYSRVKLKEAITRLNDRVGDFGYAFLKIVAKADIREDEKIVNVMFVIEKGRRVYVNRVEISGNTRTRDEVIRREVTMVEGNLFSASNLRKTRGRIGSLGFFENVDITTPLSSDPEKVNIKVAIEEKPTGSFTLGAGYSSAEAFMGTASVSQNNFLGKGQKLAFSFALSSNTTEYNIAFTEPYFMGKNMSAGIDLFNRKSSPTSANSYETKTTGAGLRLGFPISNNLRNTVSYRIASVDVNNTGNSYSRLIQAQADNSPYTQSMISNSLVWNNVDSALMPTGGRIHKLTLDLSGLGGDVKFARATTEHQFYKALSKSKDWVGLLKARAGYSSGIMGEELPIFERFQLGGATTIRGFKRGGLGPRTSLDEAYGGVIYETLSAELLFPIYGLTEKGVRGFIFADAANLHDNNLPTDVTDDASIRVSAGFGVNWNSPFGPLKVIIGIPVQKGERDQTRLFDFSMGAAF